MASSSTDRKQSKLVLTLKDIVHMALFSSILFIQEELLTLIPNVSLTIFLIILYSKKLGFLRTTIIVIIHVVLDNLVMGSFNLLYTPAMFVGWMFIPIVVCLFFDKTENVLVLSIIGLLSGFIYSWCFMLPSFIVYQINPLVYLASDVVFEMILAGCGFLSTLFLYKPCSKVFDKFNLKKVNKHNALK